jgi:hypothetical protein
MATMPSEYVAGWPDDNAIWRTARKRYRCDGNGVRQSVACREHIEPGDQYVEYTGDAAPFQRGSTHCIPCALAFEYIVPATEGADQ